MTASIPDGISLEELQSIMNDISERDSEDECSFCSDRDAIESAAQTGVRSALEIVKDPMVHKVMILDILANMIDWHTTIGERLMDDEEKEAGISWLRDAGKFQSMLTTLLSVQIGDNDWLVRE